MRLSRLLGAAVQLTGYRSAALFLLNPTTNRLKLRAAFRIEVGSMPPKVRELAQCRPDLEALTQGPVVLQSASPEDERWLPRDVSTALCVAVQSQEVPIGTLWVYDRRGRTPHEREVRAQVDRRTDRDVSSNGLCCCRENETQHRLVTEVRLASENQTGSMLDNLSVYPGFEAAARCVSRHELGGDLCELIPLLAQRTGIRHRRRVRKQRSGGHGDVSGPRGVTDPAGGQFAKAPEPRADDGAGQSNAARHHVFASVHEPVLWGIRRRDASTDLHERRASESASDPERHCVWARFARIIAVGVLKEASYSFSVLELLPGDVDRAFSVTASAKR